MQTIQELEKQQEHWEILAGISGGIGVLCFAIGLILCFYFNSKGKDCERAIFDIGEKEWNLRYEESKRQLKESTDRLNSAVENFNKQADEFDSTLKQIGFK